MWISLGCHLKQLGYDSCEENGLPGSPISKQEGQLVGYCCLLLPRAKLTAQTRVEKDMMISEYSLSMFWKKNSLSWGRLRKREGSRITANILV